MPDFWIFPGASAKTDNPQKDAFSAIDVARSLAYQTRFQGHTSRRYSVAEHSLFVAFLAPPELVGAALVHDAGEAVTGDTGRPWLTHAAAFRRLREKWQTAAFDYYGIPKDHRQDPRLQAADDLALATEASALVKIHVGEIRARGLPEPLPCALDQCFRYWNEDDWLSLYRKTLLDYLTNKPDPLKWYRRAAGRAGCLAQLDFARTVQQARSTAARGRRK